MKHSVLFLSHDPHEVHAAFASAVGARYYNTGLKKFVACTKRITWTGHFFAPISFLYSLFINVPEDIILVDGATSLYLALGIKLRRPQKRIVYLDGDTMFYVVRNAKRYQQWQAGKLLPQIDAVISVSELNRAQVNIDVPSVVCPPYPKPVTPANIVRKPHGLFVGRLDPDKNIMGVIEYALQCPAIEKFIIVGDGVLRTQVEDLAARHAKLQYEGYRTDVAKYYSSCTFLFHFPPHDPHPTVTMEAALCGCFPIMSPGTGSNYLFDPVFTIHDPSDFAFLNDRIAHIQKNGSFYRQRLAQNSKQIPSKRSSVQHFKRSFSSLIEQITV